MHLVFGCGSQTGESACKYLKMEEDFSLQLVYYVTE